ncbi:group I intron-associated PD-(D/E)XK endonuclease [Neolewinella lacunae]|uniref:group I intron-associated PD-(D/E)XK endonuclease n=1 Tax=Neolewinella lacunae TaxID=1517758 RepID=UPI001CA451CF|nr:group I intron-associated PD-(D/E)XK endonuclease [Neolewinella lacunae]MDN3636078.1 group I intron-associated PD-(D/E)XK endonuclease [Neolewinella lacunae]
MFTKQRGDIAEQAVVLQSLRRGWGVLRPVGDWLPYDLVLDVKGRLVKVQVKFAWFDEVKGNYVVDNRRTKTNRREMVRSNYSLADFDFAIAYINELDVFYVMPCAAFTGFGSEIHLVESASVSENRVLRSFVKLGT